MVCEPSRVTTLLPLRAIQTKRSSLHTEQMQRLDNLHQLIQRIDQRVEDAGYYLIGPGEIELIFDDVTDEPKRFLRICELAIRHHWAFELTKGTRTVKFKAMPK